MDLDEADLNGNGDGVPDGAEREMAVRIAEYWKANPEKLVDALRWSGANGGS